MKCIQTFWTAKQDPLIYSFGWTHPEYNLMSWALSCLSLREHYDDVELYTDSAGYHVLIEVLKLPYTKTHVIFDDFDCQPQHWALSKIKTYSLQTEPFLHIDGDIYLPHPLPEDLMHASLIAQNKEIGTRYYRNMMNHVLRMEKLQLPEYIKRGVEENSISSYNMGFFGGCDLSFIREYCDEVFRFIRLNRINDVTCPNSRVDCNVFFEQVLFAIFADNANKDVTDILGYAMQDEGYMVHDFCCLDKYDEKPFFHLLGGHKKNKRVITMLERALLRAQPALYEKIIRLFPQRYTRFASQKPPYPSMDFLSVERSLAQWEDFLQDKTKEWEDLPVEELLKLEKIIAHSNRFASMDKEKQGEVMLKCNPYMSLFRIPRNWNPRAVMLLKEKFGCEKDYPLTMFAAIPTIRAIGVETKPILKMEHNIIMELQTKGLTYEKLKANIIANGKYTTESDRKAIDFQMFYSIRSLSNYGLIINK